MPQSDDVFMAQALSLAQQAIGLSEPNPRVGCVLVDAAGRVLGQGHTQQAGGPHAEVVALQAARQVGGDLVGATAFVTLEPCAHHGRTPPCADALVAAGLARVVVALLDPNPLVGGKGVERLRAAGVVVDVMPATHPCAVQARELNIGFLSRMVRQRPWLRMKMAGSLDGRTALDNGVSQWITGEAARADGQVWRARAGAVLTGIGTVLADDPRMDVRAVPVFRQPWRVVLDSHWRMPADSRMLAGGGEVLIYGLSPDDEARGRHEALLARGVRAHIVPADALGQRLDLAYVLSDLADRGVNELHVEAGACLNAAFIQGGWVDECLIYVAPKLMGPGRGLAALPALTSLDGCVPWRFRDVQLVGGDLRILLRSPGAEVF